MNLENQPRGQPDWRDCWWTPMTQILINELREPTWRPAWLARLLVDTDDTNTDKWTKRTNLETSLTGEAVGGHWWHKNSALSAWWALLNLDAQLFAGLVDVDLTDFARWWLVNRWKTWRNFVFSVKRKASLESREEGSWIFLYFFLFVTNWHIFHLACFSYSEVFYNS